MTAVLVVDDSGSMRQLVRSMLEPHGYMVSEAADGALGMAALRTIEAPAVVLLDYHMPNMDGWEVLQAVAAAGDGLAQHEFIVITADVATFPSDYIGLLRTVSIRILPKPFSKEALVLAVDQAVERLNAPPDEPIPDTAE
jgi:CheY-like chemotaxis protein